MHPVCSLRKMEFDGKLEALARACAETVTIPDAVLCCGWAGDKGFTTPELNAHALRFLKECLPAGCSDGYSSQPDLRDRPHRSLRHTLPVDRLPDRRVHSSAGCVENDIMTQAIRSTVDTVLGRYRQDPHYLVQILREVQEACDWIPPEAIDRMQEVMRLPRTKIEGVAGFYSFLYTQPRGRYRVLFSDNITDRMLGNMELLEHMCRQLWVERGKTSEDGLVSIDTTSCTGMCDQGPAMLVNNIAVTRLTKPRIDAICELIRTGAPVSTWPSEFFKIDDNVRREDVMLASEPDPGRALTAALARGADGLLAEIKASQPARSRRRGFRDRPEMGSLPRRAGRRALRRLQRRRGRAGNVQGPGAADLVCRSRPRRDDAVRVRRRRASGAFSTCAANTATCSTTCRPSSRAGGAATCSASAFSVEPGSTSTSRSTSAPARTSAARSRR